MIGPLIRVALASLLLAGALSSAASGDPKLVDPAHGDLHLSPILPKLLPQVQSLRGLRLRRGRHPHLELIAGQAGRIRLTLRGLRRGCRHISRRCSIRTLATQVDPIRRGLNNIGLAGPMARSLKRGTSIQLTATDFLGNRSAPKSLRV